MVDSGTTVLSLYRKLESNDFTGKLVKRCTGLPYRFQPNEEQRRKVKVKCFLVLAAEDLRMTF